MPRKTLEQLAREFEGCKAKGGAAFWPHILVNAVLKPAGRGEPLSRMGEGQG